MDFSIVFASRGRVHLLSNLIHSINNTTQHLDRIEVHVGIDDDDTATHETCRQLSERFAFFHYHSRVRSHMINRDYINWCASLSSGKFFVIVNDDCEFRTMHWDTIALAKLNDYLSDKPDKICYAFLSDGLEQGEGRALGIQYSCFPLTSRAGYVALGNKAIDDSYPCWTADIVTYQIYHAAGRVLQIPEVMIFHVSCHNNARPKDEINCHVERISRGGHCDVEAQARMLRKAMGVA